MRLKKKDLNKVFLIMAVFSMVTLGAGVQIGFELRDGVYQSNQSESLDTTKALEAEEETNILDGALLPKLTIVKTDSPVVMYYEIENITASALYVEKANIKVFDKENVQIYTTSINLYKTYIPGEKDKIEFQVPQSSGSIAKVQIDFE